MTIDKLRNCPNCGGYLNDSGRCEFCGSKIYDFVQIDFDTHEKTYIRMRYQGKIITMPVVFHVADITIEHPSYTLITGDLDTRRIYDPPLMTGSIEFTVVGDAIAEKEECDNV